MNIFIKTILCIVLSAIAAHKLFMLVCEMKIEEPAPRRVFWRKVILPLIFCSLLCVIVTFGV